MDVIADYMIVICLRRGLAGRVARLSGPAWICSLPREPELT